MDPTIALFAKLPVPGGVKTRLQPTAGRAGAARLAAAMLVDRLKFVDELKDDTGHGKLLCGDRPEVTPFLPYLAQAWGQPLWGGVSIPDRARFQGVPGVIGVRDREGWDSGYFVFFRIIVREAAS